MTAGPDRLPGARLADFLDVVADASPGAAAGAGAIVTTAIAAGLVSMCARRSIGVWDEASATAGQAERLRPRATALLDEAVVAHERAIQRLGERGALKDAGAEQRDWQLGVALRRAAQAPLLCAEIAADVAELGAAAAEHCDPACRPDAVAACRLAEAAAQVCADLVEVNLVVGVEEGTRANAAAYVDRARAARERSSAVA